MHYSVSDNQITSAKPVVNKVVSGAEDLVAPLQHVGSDDHFSNFVRGVEAELESHVLLGLILLTVDKRGSVRKPGTWNALCMLLPGRNFTILIESELSTACAILPRPSGSIVSAKVERSARWESELLEAVRNAVVWHSELVIDVEVLLNDLLIVQIDNLLLCARKFFFKAVDSTFHVVDVVDHALHHVGIGFVCVVIASVGLVKQRLERHQVFRGRQGSKSSNCKEFVV